MITHRMGILAATDKIAIMQGGALSAFGSRDEIFARYIGRPHSGVARSMFPRASRLEALRVRTDAEREDSNGGGSPGPKRPQPKELHDEQSRR